MPNILPGKFQADIVKKILDLRDSYIGNEMISYNMLYF